MNFFSFISPPGIGFQVDNNIVNIYMYEINVGGTKFNSWCTLGVLAGVVLANNSEVLLGIFRGSVIDEHRWRG